MGHTNSAQIIILPLDEILKIKKKCELEKTLNLMKLPKSLYLYKSVVDHQSYENRDCLPDDDACKSQKEGICQKN